MEYFMSKCALILMIFGFTKAATDAQVRADFARHLIVCTKDHPNIPMDVLMNLQKFVVPTNKAARCLLACAYRKVKLLTDDGLFNIKAAEISNSGDEKRLANLKKLAAICLKVNDEAVSDGKKGCDRAAFMFGCITKNGPKTGIWI